MGLIKKITNLWSATDFPKDELTQYAKRFIEDEVRNGILILSIVSLLLLSTAAILYYLLGFSSAYTYTFSMLAVLALHIGISSRYIKTTAMLYMLGITLLVISGSAFVLLAHKTGTFSNALLASTVLLFMLVPLASWGLREAALVVSLIYMEFTLSSIGVFERFGSETIWLLQFLMLGSAITAITVVARTVGIRKHDITTRFELENAHREMELLSYKDTLTNAWNRRFLEQEFSKIVERQQKRNNSFHFALIDIDNFKKMNDTYGHIFGDFALQYLVKAILEQLDNKDYLFRLGGDEFALLFTDEHPVDLLEQTIKGLHHITNPCSDTNTTQQMHISVGLITVAPQQSVSLDVLYKQADKALYAAKSDSKNSGEQSHIVPQEFLLSDEN